MDKSSTVIFLAAASLAFGAAGERPLTFSLPDSILLVGDYNDLRVVAQNPELVRPPFSMGNNGGYVAAPSISPRGDSVAWGFSVEWQASRRRNRARALYSRGVLPNRSAPPSL